MSIFPDTLEAVVLGGQRLRREHAMDPFLEDRPQDEGGGDDDGCCGLDGGENVKKSAAACKVSGGNDGCVVCAYG